MIVRISTVLVIAFFAALPARAQEAEAPPDLPPPVSLTYVDGEVQFLNAGAAERATAPSMVVDGDGVRTSRGRAELVFGDGSVLHLDEGTAVDVLGDHRLRVLAGRVVFRASAAANDGYVVDTPSASVRLENRGEYNLFVDDGRRGVELSVARGVAEIELSSERLLVRAGEEARLDGPGARPVIRAFNSARLDAFAHWSLTRYEGETLSPSSRTLPVELRAYGQTFDQYGRWGNVAPYGPVWYPSVAVDWRPYYNGGWRRTRYGMTWYGNDPWAWPTHHYGRWQYSSNVWFWVPARTWGPAWVSWAYAPGYVSWAPLGWDSRPVVPFYLGVGVGHPDRRRAWTVMPRGYFGSRGSIRPWVVDGRRLSVRTDRAFIQQPIPRSAAYAVRRDGADRATGSYDRAVPRGSYTDRSGVVRPGPATREDGGGRSGAVTNGERRNPYGSPRSGGTNRTFEQEWGGMSRPRSSEQPARQPESAQPRTTQPAPQEAAPGATRRGGAAPSYAPGDRGAAGQSRSRREGDPAAGRGERTGSARGDGRSPSYARPESSSTGSAPAPRAETSRSRGGDRGEAQRGAAPRAEGARSRGESRGGRGESGGGKGSEGSSGTRSGGARRPPGQH